MADSPTSDATLTREALFPPGSPGTPEYKGGWDNIEELADEPAPSTDDEPDGAPGNDVQADAQEDEPESGDQAPDEVSSKITAKDFAKAAGWSLEEFYRDVLVKVNGEDIPLSDVLNEYPTLHSAREALSRERDELQGKLNQAAVQPTQAMPQMPEEISEKLFEAKMCERALAEGNWQGMDSGQASQQQISLMTRAQTLRNEANELVVKHHQEVQAGFQKLRDEADKQVRQLIPEWADSRVRAQDERANRDFVQAWGFRPEEYDNSADPRMRRMVQAFRQLSAKVKKVETKAKQVRKVSKTVSAGARQGLNERVSLDDAKRKINEAQGASNKQKARLTVPLG